MNHHNLLPTLLSLLLPALLGILTTASAATLELDIAYDAGSNEVELEWQGEPSASYRIYNSSDLQNWTPLTGVLIGTGQPETIQLQAPQRRHYFVLQRACDIAVDIVGPAQTPIGRISYQANIQGNEPVLGIAWSVDSTNAVVDLPTATNTHIYFFEPGDYTVSCIVSSACGTVTDAQKVTASLTAGSPSNFAAAPRELHATLHSIGLEWDLPPIDESNSDQDHDAFGMMRARIGTGPWTVSMPLLRIDYNYPDYVTNYGAPPEQNPWNMIAGSLLFLEPGRDYEVDVQLADPDGGRVQLRQKIQTRPEPVRRPIDYYVAPIGGSGGSGTQADPFRSTSAAQAVAQPGDVFYLQPGFYAEQDMNASGTRENPIQWQSSAGARFNRLYPRGNFIEFFDLRVGAAKGASTGNAAIITGEDTTGLVFKSCIVTNYNYGITLRASSRDCTILDCTIIGDNDPGVSDFGGEGIELNRGNGHAVGYNRISLVGDGVSYANRNCDIYHNDIFDTSDDGIEPDYGHANVRMWANRVRRTFHNGISFQPQYCGPWYLLYNDVVMREGEGAESCFKFNGPVDRNVMIHNTFVNLGGTVAQSGNPLATMVSRNNLFVTATDQIWRSRSRGESIYVPASSFYAFDWRSDLDFDGFAHVPGPAAYRWLDTDYGTFESFRDAVGTEPNGQFLHLSEIGDLSRDRIELPAGSSAIGAGTLLPNLHPHHQGRPDLGAYEAGSNWPAFGPRP